MIGASLRRSSTAGFTLVEALVATVLMGMILAALATVTAQWLPNWNRGFVRVQRTELLAIAIERLAADFAAAEFVPPNRCLKAPSCPPLLCDRPSGRIPGPASRSYEFQNRRIGKGRSWSGRRQSSRPVPARSVRFSSVTRSY